MRRRRRRELLFVDEPQPQECGVEGIELLEKFGMLDQIVDVQFQERSSRRERRSAGVDFRFWFALLEAGFERRREFLPPQVLIRLCSDEELFLGGVQFAELLPLAVFFF